MLVTVGDTLWWHHACSAWYGCRWGQVLRQSLLVAPTGLELIMWIRLVLNLQWSFCFCLTSAGITGMYHHIRPLNRFTKCTVNKAWWGICMAGSNRLKNSYLRNSTKTTTISVLGRHEDSQEWLPLAGSPIIPLSEPIHTGLYFSHSLSPFGFFCFDNRIRSWPLSSLIVRRAWRPQRWREKLNIVQLPAGAAA